MGKNIEEEMLENFKEEMKGDSSCECDCGCDCNCEEFGCDCGDCCCGWDYEECDCGCCYEDDCDDDFSGDAKDILEYCYDEFSDEIQKKGEHYYLDGRVSKVIKNKAGDIYTAKVYGSMDEPYEVNIFADKLGFDYDCTCPCEYPCKHVYATMLAIDDGEYVEKELRPNIERNSYTIEELIEKVPAEELKTYLLKENGLDGVTFCFMKLAKRFDSYLPCQTYEFYYNNLYNRLVFDEEYILFEYLNEIKEQIAKQKYEESFKIIKAIVEAYNDTNKINEDNELTDVIPQLTMYLRVTSRKGNEGLKEEIRTWMMSVKENKYYDNVYIEDALVEFDK